LAAILPCASALFYVCIAAVACPGKDKKPATGSDWQIESVVIVRPWPWRLLGDWLRATLVLIFPGWIAPAESALADGVTLMTYR